MPDNELNLVIKSANCKQRELFPIVQSSISKEQSFINPVRFRAIKNILNR